MATRTKKSLGAVGGGQGVPSPMHDEAKPGSLPGPAVALDKLVNDELVRAYGSLGPGNIIGRLDAILSELVRARLERGDVQGK